MTNQPERQRPRVIPQKPLRAAVQMTFMVAVLWALELWDQLNGQRLDQYGIEPHRIDGLDGVLWAPLLHGGLPHLMSNTVPLLVLGWLLLANGVGQFVAVTATVWLVAGLGTWLIADGGTHIGASGVAFGWMVFLLVRGFFVRSFAQILVAVVLFFYWGGMLWGVLPTQPQISWQGHLCGALGGLLAAWLVARSTRRGAEKAAPGTLSA
ncbi:membrane associated rhomboid family serine protease [Saccharopolyspora gloriosae]|uniref:Membrane associated rhomboid family serine protease n=1 Tax=Saccharopolyspora gloriosae TaxID=455344 RepID=A0A840NE72_9PSEU|nr:membrane associated rhomboid family serine protease [Saccharopolyspora gloriosae]